MIIMNNVYILINQSDVFNHHMISNRKKVSLTQHTFFSGFSENLIVFLFLCDNNSQRGVMCHAQPHPANHAYNHMCCNSLNLTIL